MTIKEIFEKKANESKSEDLLYGFDYYVKSYNGLVDLRYELVQDASLETSDYEIYVNGSRITLNIINQSVEATLLTLQNAKIDEQKIANFSSRLTHFVNKYGKQELIKILQSQNIKAE